MAAHFEPVVNANCRLVAPPPTRRTAIGGYPKVASDDMLDEQLHYFNPVKQVHAINLINMMLNDHYSLYLFYKTDLSGLAYRLRHEYVTIEMNTSQSKL